MEKFSSRKNKVYKAPKNDVLYENDHVKLVEYENWSIITGKDMIVCIPYFIETNQFLIRHEYIPTFKFAEGQEYHVTVLSGGVENDEEVKTSLLRELEEEAGIVLREDYKIEDLKPLFVSKGNANKYHPFIVPLNENDYHEVVAKGDGSKSESLSKSVKIDVKFIDSLNTSDLITDYMLYKLKEYLNLI